MGYSSPKKQLDLTEFLSKPSTPKKPRNTWNRSRAPSAARGSVAVKSGTPDKVAATDEVAG